MDNKENKKWSFAHFCAYISLALSITMLVLWCCNVGGFTVVSLDSFVGIIVALLAIVVTIVLGWQIYNAIELKRKIEELDELKDMLSVQEKEIKTQTNYTNHLTFGSLADIEITNGNYTSAFLYLIRSLEYTMSLDAPLDIDAIFGRMNISVNKVKQNSSLPVDIKKDIQDSDKQIRASSCYSMIKTQYEKVYNEFFSKIKDGENS